jgi:hypothetical protein
MKTDALADLVLKKYSLPHQQMITYTRHLALLRKYIRETDSSELLSDLHRKFSAWVAEKNLSNPTEEEWGEVMLEDERCYSDPGQEEDVQLPDSEEEPALYRMGEEPTEYGASLATVLLQGQSARNTEQ